MGAELDPTAVANEPLSPRVAVVVPCFNDGRFIIDALESLAAQEPHELIVVDDGSTDPDTLDTLDALRAAGTTVLSKPNAGLGPARMTGVAASTAPFIHPLDSDDRLAPGALTLLADALEGHPEAGAAWGSYRSFGTANCLFPTASSLDPWRITFFDELPAVAMLRRSALEAVGGWDHVGYEDWDLWMKMAEAGISGIGVQNTTLFYREHATPRLLSSSLKRHDDHFAVLRDRHRPLFDARAAHRRRSDSPRAIKILWSAIDLAPGLSHLHKRRLITLVRYLLQREMCSDCFRGPGQRLSDAIRRKLRRFASTDPA